jgi:hypothetical protein
MILPFLIPVTTHSAIGPCPQLPPARHPRTIGACPDPPSSLAKMPNTCARTSLLPMRRPARRAPRQRPAATFHGRRQMRRREPCCHSYRRGAMALPSSTDSTSACASVAVLRSSAAVPCERDPAGV